MLLAFRVSQVFLSLLQTLCALGFVGLFFFKGVWGGGGATIRASRVS